MGNFYHCVIALTSSVFDSLACVTERASGL